jgi:hypothetical protein
VPYAGAGGVDSANFDGRGGDGSAEGWYVAGRRRIVAHVGSAHTEAELGVLLEKARLLLEDAGQQQLDLGVEPVPRKAPGRSWPENGMTRPTPTAG